MNKEEFIYKLRLILRELTFMNEAVFEERFKDGVMSFDRYSWGEKEKTHTIIQMIKKNVES